MQNINNVENKIEDRINHTLLQHIVQQKDPSAHVINYKIKPAVKNGENYLGLLYRITVQYTNDQNEPATKSLIVKDLPNNKYTQKYINESELFKREKLMYNRILPKLHELSINNLTPTYYKTTVDILIFDDLTEYQYKMADRQLQLNYDHSKLALSKLAEFHALSVALIQNDNEFEKEYPETFLVKDNVNYVKQFMVSNLKTLTKVVRSWSEVGEKFGPKLEAISDTIWERITNMVKRADEQVNVINHGDFWINNIMFKYVDNTVVDAKLIDFQASFYGSPALDILYFLHTSVRNEECYEMLIETYFNEFRNTLIKNNCDPNILTLETLQNEIMEKAFFGFYAVCTVLPAVVANPSNQIDSNELTEKSLAQIDAENESPLLKIFIGELFKTAFIKKLLYFDKIGVL